MDVLCTGERLLEVTWLGGVYDCSLPEARSEIPERNDFSADEDSHHLYICFSFVVPSLARGILSLVDSSEQRLR